MKYDSNLIINRKQEKIRKCFDNKTFYHYKYKYYTPISFDDLRMESLYYNKNKLSEDKQEYEYVKKSMDKIGNKDYIFYFSLKNNNFLYNKLKLFLIKSTLSYYCFKIVDINIKNMSLKIKDDKSYFLKKIFEHSDTIKKYENDNLTIIINISVIKYFNKSIYIIKKSLQEYNKDYIKVELLESLNKLKITFIKKLQ